MHVHAFSPMEVMNGVARTGLPLREWLLRAKEAGVGSLPGTAAEILDDDVRWVLTKGKLPARDWIEVITTAHQLGIRTTATMMYGHVDAPHHWVGHLRVIRGIQQQTGGFTEFVLLPFVHTSAPIYLAGLARPGVTRRENRAVHALSRIMLHGAIDSIQCSWVKLGDDLCRDVLTGGVNDLGGTLMEETISRMAGADNGSYKTITDLRNIVAPLGRPLRQRTTAVRHAGRGPHRRGGGKRRRLRVGTGGPAHTGPLKSLVSGIGWSRRLAFGMNALRRPGSRWRRAMTKAWLPAIQGHIARVGCRRRQAV